MHRSRLITVFVDCVEHDYERSLEFWGAALGKEIMRRAERYASLRGRIGGEGGVLVALQRVPKEERGIHLDIETDDVQAEVRRLEKLGARVKVRIRSHVVMKSSSGHVFCVVPIERGDFPAKATEWTE